MLILRGGIHVDDIGTLLTGTFLSEDGDVFDISAATTKNFSLQKPGGTTITRAGSFVTDGTDGRISYRLESGDVSEAGYWYVQGHVAFASGHTFKSDRVRIRVWPNNAAAS